MTQTKNQVQTMQVELIRGQFDSQDIIDIITQLIHVKIKYHEQKIDDNSTEEDIKNREAKIKSLQMQLYEARKYLKNTNQKLNVESIIRIN